MKQHFVLKTINMATFITLCDIPLVLGARFIDHSQVSQMLSDICVQRSQCTNKNVFCNHLCQWLFAWESGKVKRSICIYLLLEWSTYGVFLLWCWLAILTGILTNFAGGIVYTYFKYIESQYQSSPGSTVSTPREDKVSLEWNLKYSKSSANGHCVQDHAESPAETAHMVWSLGFMDFSFSIFCFSFIHTTSPPDTLLQYYVPLIRNEDLKLEAISIENEMFWYHSLWLFCWKCSFYKFYTVSSFHILWVFGVRFCCSLFSFSSTLLCVSHLVVVSMAYKPGGCSSLSRQSTFWGNR